MVTWSPTRCGQTIGSTRATRTAPHEPPDEHRLDATRRAAVRPPARHQQVGNDTTALNQDTSQLQGAESALNAAQAHVVAAGLTPHGAPHLPRRCGAGPQRPRGRQSGHGRRLPVCRLGQLLGGGEREWLNAGPVARLSWRPAWPRRRPRCRRLVRRPRPPPSGQRSIHPDGPPAPPGRPAPRRARHRYAGAVTATRRNELGPSIGETLHQLSGVDSSLNSANASSSLRGSSASAPLHTCLGGVQDRAERGRIGPTTSGRRQGHLGGVGPLRSTRRRSRRGARLPLRLPGP